MDNKFITLSEFLSDYRFLGNWELSYTDCTHLEPEKYVPLGSFSIDSPNSSEVDYPILPFIYQVPAIAQIASGFEEAENDKRERAAKLIIEQIAESLMRTGLLRPIIRVFEEHELLESSQVILESLSRYGYLITVVDTSALRRGAVSFLNISLRDILIWTVIPVFVMTEIQRQVQDLTANSRKGRSFDRYNLLKQRPQVACISRELNNIRQWRPVEILTTMAEHLGKIDGKSTVDRLIIESVKNLKRERGIQQGIYLLTADKDMASLAALENVRTIHFDVPDLDEKVCSVRYDSRNQIFVLSPIHYLLWDLTQVFSQLRVENSQTHKCYELVYYNSARAGFFAHDVLEIREI